MAKSVLSLFLAAAWSISILAILSTNLVLMH